GVLNRRTGCTHSPSGRPRPVACGGFGNRPDPPRSGPHGIRHRYDSAWGELRVAGPPGAGKTSPGESFPHVGPP
ncbi:hypothetical protein ABZ353_31325, partial [Streptomyces niveus]|uniref:hypothetical protein n=1 Tax=Streptomyces niveus TaxID=193462 RepID=UPI0033DE5E81